MLKRRRYPVDDIGIFIVGIVIFAMTVVGTLNAGFRAMRASIDSHDNVKSESRPEE
jgi:hypothetical protein